MTKKALVLGGGGFIGTHLVNRLKDEGYWVRAVDLKLPVFSDTTADDFIVGDLRNFDVCSGAMDQQFDEVYQLAAYLGGAGFIYTGDNDADILHNSALINLNVLKASLIHNNKKIFYSSSACVYPIHNQLDPKNPNCLESTVYPANPDSEYGWEKLFSERLYMSFAKNYNINVKIARYHGIFGPLGDWIGGNEKAPAALCRKIAMAGNNGTVEVWGDGMQTRSFLFIDDCIDATIKLMRSDCKVIVNIGSDQLVSINDLVEIISDIAGKKIVKKHIDGPLGVRGRNSDNQLIKKELSWQPSITLKEGINQTYNWVIDQINKG